MALAPLLNSGQPAGAGGLGTRRDRGRRHQSEYSHIRIRRQGSMRTMNFVRDNGVEQIETVWNMKQPYDLVTQYSRLMFASYFFMPQQKQVLIVGLGGGAMVHFYEHYDPEVKVDAVEIDEKVVELADKYFDVRTQKNTKIITEDAFKYFKTNKTRYDVIYMDAFLKPSEQTDATGQPLRLKTIEFYKGLREQLTPEGIVVINLNIHQGTNDDLATIRGAYPQAYAFRASTPNLIVVCTWDKTRVTAAALHEKAEELDRRFKATFTFQSVLETHGEIANARRTQSKQQPAAANRLPARPSGAIPRASASGQAVPRSGRRPRAVPLARRQRHPAGASGREGPWPVRAIARNSSSRSPSAAATARGLPQEDVPKGRLAGVRSRGGDSPAGNVEAGDLARAAAQRASHQSCEATASGSGKASSTSGRFAAQAHPSTKLRPSSVFSGRPEP